MQTIPSMSQQVVLLMGFCKKLFGKNTDHFYAPVAGKTVPFSEVPDPTATVHEEVQVLQTHLGISGTIIPKVYQRYYKLPSGVYVSRVMDKSEAKEKGLIAGDIITALNGQAIQEDTVLDLWTKTFTAGNSVELTVYRSGSEFTVTLIWNEAI